MDLLYEQRGTINKFVKFDNSDAFVSFWLPEDHATCRRSHEINVDIVRHKSCLELVF